MDDSFEVLADGIAQLIKDARVAYLPLVDDICRGNATKDEFAHLLDGLLDFAYDDEILKMYKRVCRRYVYRYPDYIKFYIDSYREMWDSEEQ